MARGVQLGNYWRRIRLVQAYYDEQKKLLLLAQAVAHGANGSDQADQIFRDLVSHMFPDEVDDQTVEEMRETLKQEEKKEYYVAPLFD